MEWLLQLLPEVTSILNDSMREICAGVTVLWNHFRNFHPAQIPSKLLQMRIASLGRRSTFDKESVWKLFRKPGILRRVEH